jgi:hypothetical protein
VAGAACCFDLAAIAGRPYLRSPDDRGEEIAVSGDSSAKQKQKDGGGSSTTAI